ncbi:hypothetical protein [Streptomyces mutabilis]|uniref:hypothetical protein n=1 Tax=Streptomyces TaxID=1883 RepID=UPI0039878D93
MAAVVRLTSPAPFVPDERHLQPVAALRVCHSGANVEADPAPLHALGTPAFNLIGPKPYVAQQSMIDSMDSKGLNQ